MDKNNNAAAEASGVRMGRPPRNDTDSAWVDRLVDAYAKARQRGYEAQGDRKIGEMRLHFYQAAGFAQLLAEFFGSTPGREESVQLWGQRAQRYRSLAFTRTRTAVTNLGAVMP